MAAKKRKPPKLLPTGCEGCGGCCGIAPCTQEEFDAVGAYAKEHGLSPIAQGVTCPWRTSKGCAVYPVRPTVCQVFGHDPRLPCPHGHNRPDTKVARKMVQAMGRPTRTLHEHLEGVSGDFGFLALLERAFGGM